MSRCLSRAVLVSVAASVSLMVIVGCDGRPGRIHPPKINPATAAAEAMKQYDTNQDGKIDKEELTKCSFFNSLAKDGVVTSDAIVAELTKWKDLNLGRVKWDANITHNKKPVTKATVKLVPEKFLGANMIAAEGVTDDFGGVTLSVPRKSVDDPRGVQLGFYRLEVTKDGESIPAKYNTESTLCVHVGGGQGPTSASFVLVY